MQCGLCAVVASLFRRAMCIAGSSRRGSGESANSYREIPEPASVNVKRVSVKSRRDSQQQCEVTTMRRKSYARPEEDEDDEEEKMRVCERHASEAMLDLSSEQNALIKRISESERKMPTQTMQEKTIVPSFAEDAIDALERSQQLRATPTTDEAAELAREGDEDVDVAAELLSCRLDELERLLLERLDVSQYRPKHTGRFLTMHKRRRKRLVTRSLDQEPGLLDDVSHGQVQCVLQRVANWKFNAFTLETATGGRSLPVLCVHLFHWYGLLQHFKLDVVRVWKLFTLIEEGYHSTNPYHNSIHAADVTQAMHCFLQEQQIRQNLSYLEIMASLIAAVTHDLDHPGVNQPFLVATSNHLAALYENTSVLENHHWRSAVGCLLESGVSEQLPDSVKPELQRHISSLILATDITRQQEFLTRFKHYLDNRELDMNQAEHRHFILQIALKCADISNPCRPWDISRKWAHKVCEEFFRQGDYERQLSLPVTPLYDRYATSIPKIQVGFFKFVVFPLYEEWHRFLNDSFSSSLMDHLLANQSQWEALIRQENEAAAAAAEAAAAAVTLNVPQEADLAADVVEASECTEEDSGSLELPIPSPGLAPPPTGHERDGRRHSVPLGVSRTLTQAPRPTTARRESLPGVGGGASLVPSRLSSRSSLLRSSDGATSSPSAQLTAATSASISPSYCCTASNNGHAPPDRPDSAENLLPDTSIASIANSLEACRLSSLVQQQPWEQLLLEQQPAPRQGTLTRQQTFPPLQPFARMRYMSTTVEMSQCCTEVLLEADSSSSRSTSPAAPATITTTSSEKAISSCKQDTLVPPATLTTSSSVGGELRRHSTPAQTKSRATASNGTGRRFTTIPLTQEMQKEAAGSGHMVFFIGSPPDSPPRHPSATPSSDSGSGSVGGEPRKSVDSVSLPGNKRDYSDGSGREKSSKMLKLMKENVDPRAGEEMARGSIGLSNRRASNQSWARRRGSAPVGLLARLDDASSTTNRPTDPYSRRGSVPADMTAQPNGGANRLGLSIRSEKLAGNRRRSSLPHEAALGNLLSNLAQLAADRENYPLNNNNNNNNNSGSNNNGFSRLTHEGSVITSTTATTVATTTILSSRRGSVPADISELRRDPLGRNSVNSSSVKSRNNRSNSKKLLRRRSSGGPEMFASGATADGNDNASNIPTWQQHNRSKRDFSKRDNAIAESTQTQPLLAKRRGSLPIEMIAVSLTGRYNIHR